MSITASLEVHGLPEIFQFLGLSRQSGFLTVTGERDAAGIAFRNGRVLYARTTSSKRIGEALVEQGLLTEADLGTALAFQRTKRKQALGSILLELGLATRETLEQHVARHCLLILADVITWSRGNYRFEPLDPDDSERILADGLDTTALVMEAVRPPEPAAPAAAPATAPADLQLVA
jgi:hypothetical protein